MTPSVAPAGRVSPTTDGPQGQHTTTHYDVRPVAITSEWSSMGNHLT